MKLEKVEEKNNCRNTRIRLIETFDNLSIHQERVNNYIRNKSYDFIYPDVINSINTSYVSKNHYLSQLIISYHIFDEGNFTNDLQHVIATYRTKDPGFLKNFIDNDKHICDFLRKEEEKDIIFNCWENPYEHQFDFLSSITGIVFWNYIYPELRDKMVDIFN